MTEPYGGRPDDAPAHPEPDPRLRGFPPPVPPGWAAPGPHATTPQLTPVYGARPAPPPLPPGWPPPPVLPTGSVRYPQLLRGPRYRWWKPLLTLLLAGALFLLSSLLAVVPPLLVGLVTGVPDLARYVYTTVTDVAHLGPVGFVAANVPLILLIPSAMLATRVVHGVSPRFLASVTGGIRWRWLLRCAVVVLPLWAVYIGFTLLVDRPPADRPAHWPVLLVIVALMTPLQAAGEEYLFRGIVLQNVGAWFARPLVGLVVATAVSAITFSAAHLSPDPWVLGSIACLAVANSLAAWRTGGLEAGIAIHGVNNLFAFGVTIGIGGWQQAFITSDTQGNPVMFVLALLVDGAALALIWWQARRTGLEHRSRPSSLPPALAPPAWQPVAPVSPTS